MTGKEIHTQKNDFLRLFWKKVVRNVSRWAWHMRKRVIYRKKANLFEIGSIENGFTNGDLSIESFAQEHRIHRSTLTRLIKQHCGMSPMEYLNSFRMQEALHLLYDTEYTVKEIAECCGFNNPNYFSKVILHRFGKVPTELRKSQFTTNQTTIS